MFDPQSSFPWHSSLLWGLHVGAVPLFRDHLRGRWGSNLDPSKGFGKVDENAQREMWR
jgi:hypothetical protein